MSNDPQELSRRAFGKRVAICTLGTVIAITLGPRLAAAQSKMTQQAAQYQDTPKGKQSCSNCSQFQSPKSCKLVEGDVSPQGWCMIFQASS